jgi:hypothetical protein
LLRRAFHPDGESRQLLDHDPAEARLRSQLGLKRLGPTLDLGSIRFNDHDARARQAMLEAIGA